MFNISWKWWRPLISYRIRRINKWCKPRWNSKQIFSWISLCSSCSITKCNSFQTETYVKTFLSLYPTSTLFEKCAITVDPGTKTVHWSKNTAKLNTPIKTWLIYNFSVQFGQVHLIRWTLNSHLHPRLLDYHVWYRHSLPKSPQKSVMGVTKSSTRHL